MTSSPAPDPHQGPSARTKIAVLVALAIPLFFIGIGSVALLEPDEPYYAVPAREMLETGSWQVPLFHGKPWFDKPILFYWVILGAYRLFGVTELSTRIGSALAGLLGVILLYLVGRRGSLGERPAFLAALVLATNIEYILMARTAVTDITLTASLTLGMLAASRCLASGRTAWAALSGAAFGLATLTKGPVGLLLPGVAIGAYAILARRDDPFRTKPIVAAAAAAGAVAAPWYLYMAVVHHDLLFETFLGEGNLGRFVSPEHVWFTGYYVAVLAAGFLPWSGALPASLIAAGRPSAWAGEKGSGTAPGPLFELCWFASVVGVFSLSASKLPSYLLPAFPPGAMLIARYWDGALGSGAREAGVLDPGAGPAPQGPAGPGQSSRRGRLVTAWLGVILAGATVLAASLFGSSRKEEAVGGVAVAIAAIVLLGSLLALAAVRRRMLAAFTSIQAATSLAAILLLVFLALPRIEPLVSARPLVRDLERRGVAGEVLGTYQQSRLFSLDYYLGRTTERIPDLESLRRRVAASPGGIWIVRDRDLERLASDPEITGTPVVRGPDLSAARLAPRAAAPPEARTGS